MNPTMKRILLVSTTSLVLLGGLVTLSAWSCHRARDPAEVKAMVDSRVDDALDDLNATPEQRTHIHALASDLLSSVQKLHTDGKSARETVLSAWKSATPDRASLHALLDKRIDALRAVAHQALDTGLAIHDTLSPEQRDRVTRKVERRMSW